MTNVSRHGLWILISAPSLRRVEKFLAFDLFPWFLDAPIGAVLDVEFQGPDHLRWPKLDIDLALDSIDHPKRFPLVSRRRPIARARKTTSKSPAQVTRR